MIAHEIIKMFGGGFGEDTTMQMKVREADLPDEAVLFAKVNKMKTFSQWEYRSGKDRRTGEDRRKGQDEGHEGPERRSGIERRSGKDRRRSS